MRGSGGAPSKVGFAMGDDSEDAYQNSKWAGRTAIWLYIVAINQALDRPWSKGGILRFVSGGTWAVTAAVCACETI